MELIFDLQITLDPLKEGLLYNIITIQGLFSLYFVVQSRGSETAVLTVFSRVSVYRPADWVRITGLSPFEWHRFKIMDYLNGTSIQINNDSYWIDGASSTSFQPKPTGRTKFLVQAASTNDGKSVVMPARMRDLSIKASGARIPDSHKKIVIILATVIAALLFGIVIGIIMAMKRKGRIAQKQSDEGERHPSAIDLSEVAVEHDQNTNHTTIGKSITNSNAKLPKQEPGSMEGPQRENLYARRNVKMTNRITARDQLNDELSFEGIDPETAAKITQLTETSARETPRRDIRWHSSRTVPSERNRRWTAEI